MIVWIKEHLNNSLFQNTYTLMLMRVMATGFGYLFWVLASQMISVDYVGIASGSVNAAMLLAGFAHLGLGYGLVRQLAHTSNPNGLLNFSILATCLTGLGISIVFLLGVHVWSPVLSVINETFFSTTLFILLALGLSLSRIVFNIFLATRRMGFGLIKQTIQSLLGVALLFCLRGIVPGYIAVLSAYTFAIILSLAISFPFLPIVQPGYKFSLLPNLPIFSSFTKYSFINYLLEQTKNLPTLLLPLAVLNVLGAAAGAYFSITWSIGRGLVSLIGSVSETLFSEGSSNPAIASSYTHKSIQLSSLLSLGTIVGTIVGGKLILSFYGQNYLENCLQLLYVVTFAILPEVIILIIASYLRIRDRLNSVFIILAASSLLGIIFSWGGMSRSGINGAGLGWLLSQVLVLVMVFIWQQIKRLGMNKHSWAQVFQTIKLR